MKRTFKSLLAAAGLAFIGLGSLLTATPAQAAYVAPYVCDLANYLAKIGELFGNFSFFRQNTNYGSAPNP